MSSLPAHKLAEPIGEAAPARAPDAGAPERPCGPLAWWPYLYPQRLLSWLMLNATRIRFGPWKNWQIRWFIRRYGVDLGATERRDPRDYPHFNAFFTRTLGAGARPIDAAADSVVSPVDGTVAQVGRIDDGLLVQAKGMHYHLARLLGDDEFARALEGGSYLTAYLAPRDYHRVHMPYPGRLEEMVHVPGRLFSVNPFTSTVVPELLARNERVVCRFRTDLGPLAVVLVGAVFVGSIDTVWAGSITPPRPARVSRTRYLDAAAPCFERGDELGRFNMGSTVVTVLPPGAVRLADLRPGQPLRMGERIATASQHRDASGSVPALPGPDSGQR